MEDEFFEYYTQLVAISRADAAINQPRTRHTKSSPYHSSCSKREKLASGQVWTRQPWANVFARFTAHGCSSLVCVRIVSCRWSCKLLCRVAAD